MELDCTMYDNLYFKCIRGHAIYPIVCYTVDSKGEKHETSFNWYGKHTPIDTAKCAIFPKGKTTWEGFVPPCKFKDGDVLTYMFYNKPTIYIYRENGSCNTSYYAGYSFYNERFYKTANGGLCGDRADLRFATEEEKQKLFKAIKDNGYRWNAETKTLEELVEPKFHKGDWITNGDYTWKIVEVNPLGYILQSQDGNIVDDTISHVDEQFHSFTIEDAKDGDVLTINWYGGYDYWEKIIIFKEYHNTDVGGHVEGYGNTFKNGKLAFNEEVPYYSKTWTRNLQPANKEQRELLFQKIKEAGYRWNEETKALEKLTSTKFKPGDVLVSDLGNMVLLSHIDSENIVHYHCIITTYNSFRIEENTAVGVGKCRDCVLANEQQRQRMYDKIKSSGYEYNQTTNKLEKMDEPGFKDGDIVFSGKDLISIFKKLSPYKSLHSYVSTMHNGCVFVDVDCWTSDNMRLAT